MESPEQYNWVDALAFTTHQIIMTYIPTIAELEEMGFDNGVKKELSNRATLTYFDDCWKLRFDDGWDNHCSDIIYPQSRKDIETLVRLFTKP